MNNVNKKTKRIRKDSKSNKKTSRRGVMSKKRKLFCSICGEVIGVLNAGLVSSVQGYIAHPECRKRKR